MTLQNIIGELDQLLEKQGVAGLSSRERAVAVKSLLTLPSMAKELAYETAIKDIRTYRELVANSAAR